MYALIIDDEQEICILLTHILQRMDIAVDYSPTIEEGMKKYKVQQPDIIFLDINLPDGNGLNHIRSVKNENNRVIMISASAKPSDQLTAFSEGADYFLHKPFSKQRVIEIIDQVTRKKAI